MTKNPENQKPDDLAQAVQTMREPLGRLGIIVRRLKEMQPVPPPLVPDIGTVCSGGNGE